MKFGHSPKAVADYVLFLAKEQKNPLTPMQLLKLVFISHGWLLGLYSRPLVNEPIEAWRYGPVIPSLYRAYKRYGSQFIDEAPAGEPSELDADEKKTLREVFDGYGKMSGMSLSSLTHQAGTPWAVTVNNLGWGAVISNDLIEDYYRRLSA